MTKQPLWIGVLEVVILMISFVAAVGHERKTAATIEPYDAILVPCDLVPCFFASTRTWLGIAS